MSDETNTPVAPEEPWNPPAGDEDWSSLFAAEDGTGQPQVAAPEPVEPPSAEPAPPAPEKSAPPREEFFLEVPTGTRYKNKDEAIRGYEEKDRMINYLRGVAIAKDGVDPLRSRPDGSPQDFQRPSYLQDPDLYAKDLTESANTKQYRKYLEAQARLIDEVVQTRYGHLLPIVEKVGRQEALDSVASENPAFKDFYKSEDFNKVLDQRPALRKAIQAAETNPQFQGDLPELYKLAYDSSLASKTPELVSRGTAPAAPTPTPRMPMSSPRLTPNSAPTSNAKPTLSTSDGRKALMRELEAKGILDQQF